MELSLEGHTGVCQVKKQGKTFQAWDWSKKWHRGMKIKHALGLSKNTVSCNTEHKGWKGYKTMMGKVDFFNVQF